MGIRERHVYCSNSIPSVLIYNYGSKPNPKIFSKIFFIELSRYLRLVFDYEQRKLGNLNLAFQQRL